MDIRDTGNTRNTVDIRNTVDNGDTGETGYAIGMHTRYEAHLAPASASASASASTRVREHALTRNRRQRTRGFTLIEIMVVVVILGILAAIVVPRVMDRPDDARLAKVRSDIRALESALNLYRLDNFVYPSTSQGLEALTQRPATGVTPTNYRAGGYMDRLPMDPWGNSYQYLHPGNHGEIDIFSLGADGSRGGSGINADIGNWNMDGPRN